MITSLSFTDASEKSSLSLTVTTLLVHMPVQAYVVCQPTQSACHFKHLREQVSSGTKEVTKAMQAVLDATALQLKNNWVCTISFLSFVLSLFLSFLAHELGHAVRL